MKPITMNEVLKIINGKIVKGFDDLLIHHAAAYIEYVKNPYTILFLKSYNVDLSKIQKYSPSAIVADNLSERILSLECTTIILVEKIETAYWNFVEFYRNQFQIPVIAITGTCGKTTTKEMIKHILSQNHKVVATQNSANGRPGHFVYLTRIDETTEVGVFETAVGAPGDLIYSFSHFRPMIGIITNIGIDHLDQCKSIEGYIKAKAEMLTELPSDGILIINADDENTKRTGIETFKGKIVKYGTGNDAHFRASEIEYREEGMTFTLTLQKMKYPIYVPGLGIHQVYNTLAALAAVHELGIGIKESAQFLLSFNNIRSHLQKINGINGCLIIDDTWSSNPTSMKAAFQTLTDTTKEKKKIVLIGSIGALGEKAVEIDQEIGNMIATMDLDIIIALGPTAQRITNQARLKGFNGELYHFTAIKGVFEFLRKLLNQDTVILAKCSMFDNAFKELLTELKER